jgi:signal transduction histidine kinase
MDNMENIFGRMYSFGTELLDSKKLIFHFEVDEKLNHTKLSMNDRKNFYLIFKEALNNAVKYSECDTVCVKIEHAKPHTKMIVKDNGKGFDTANAKNGNGLSNMQERAKQIKGKLSIDSATGQGSVITLVY